MPTQKEQQQVTPPTIRIEADTLSSPSRNASDQSVTTSVNSRGFQPTMNTPRRSVDSIATIGTITSATTATGNRRFMFSMDSKSGSMNYSPLGNNSIYEVVMNTRYKHWLQTPTNLDITPIELSKNEIADDWNQVVSDYVSDIQDDADIFVNRSNLKNINRLEEMKLYQNNEEESDDLEVNSDNENNLNIIEEENDISSQVPEFFFEKSFSLDNERTFRKVLDGIDLKLQGSINASKSIENSEADNVNEVENKNERDMAYLELKDRLSDYLDIVETSLVSELSKSSHKFFYALSEVDNIQQKASDTVNDLNKLEGLLKETDEKDVIKRIEHIKKVFKRKNVEEFEQGLLQVKLTLNKVEECKSLYEKEEFEKCLDMIVKIDHLIRGDYTSDNTVQEWTANWPYKLADLKSVPALVGTREYLTNMKIEIGGKLSLQLSDILLEDIRSYYENIDTNETLTRFQTGYDDKKIFSEFKPEFKQSVKEIIQKLNRCEELVSAFSIYQDKCMTECKSIIKKYLPTSQNTPQSAVDSSLPSSASLYTQKQDDSMIADTSLSEVKQETSPTAPKLSTLLREQTPLEFQEMLVEIFTHCSEALRRLYQHQKLLLDIALKEINSSSGNNPSENQYNMITQLDIRTSINDIISVVQLRMGKVISVRRELSSALRYDHFLKLYAIVVLFIQECEALSGEFLTKYLSDALASQIKNCISTKDVKNVRSIQKMIELENWTPFIVNPSFQKEVNEIVSCVDIDPIDWTNLLDITTKYDKEDSKNATGDSQDKSGTASPNHKGTYSGNRKSVVVGDKTFVASDSLLKAISLIREVLILSTNLPTIYLSYFEKLCYSLLKYFNNYAIASVSQQGKPIGKLGKNLSIMGETLDCLTDFIGIVQRFYQRISNSSKDFEPYDPTNYATLLKQYQASSLKIYEANAPPPPV